MLQYKCFYTKAKVLELLEGAFEDGQRDIESVLTSKLPSSVPHKVYSLFINQKKQSNLTRNIFKQTGVDYVNLMCCTKS